MLVIYFWWAFVWMTYLATRGKMKHGVSLQVLNLN